MEFKGKLGKPSFGAVYCGFDPDWDKVSRRVKARRELKARDPQYFEAVSAVLFEHDPVGINYGNNYDEYDPETATIIPRLPECNSESDVSELLQDVFVYWFTEQLAPNDDVVHAIARDIWALYSAYAKGHQRDLPH